MILSVIEAYCFSTRQRQTLNCMYHPFIFTSSDRCFSTLSTINIYSVTFIWKISNQKSNDVPLDKIFVIFVGHYFLSDGWHCISFLVFLFVFIISLIYHNKNDWLFLILGVFYIWSQLHFNADSFQAETMICVSITFVYQIICFAYILQQQFMFYFCILFYFF